MATILSSPLQRPKKLVCYGKATSRTISSSQWLGDEDDEPAAPQPALSTVKESYTVQKVGGTKRIEKPEVKKQETSNEAGLKFEAITKSRNANEESQPMTAAARLKLRREQANGALLAAQSISLMTKTAPNKRAGAITPDADAVSPRKRTRISPSKNNEVEHALTTNLLRKIDCDMSLPKGDAFVMEVDVYAFPDNPVVHASSTRSSNANIWQRLPAHVALRRLLRQCLRQRRDFLLPPA
ncbi:hypothetical protein LTR17_027075 [Elasticomyces elasticus]|nr:hypothetical protein LTR17_027075 [Elasticomyces elasticus]